MAYLHNLIRDEILDEFLDDVAAPAVSESIQENNLEPTNEVKDGLSQNISKRPRRANAGAKMASLMNSMEKDDFYQKSYGGFEDEEDDIDFDPLMVRLSDLSDLSDAEEDDVDSDFSIDENVEQPKPDVKDDEKEEQENFPLISFYKKIPDEDYEKIIPRHSIKVENNAQFHEENPEPKILRQANGIWICQDCSKPFKTEVGAKRHYNTKHQKNNAQPEIEAPDVLVDEPMPKKIKREIKTENAFYQEIEQEPLLEHSGAEDDDEIIQRPASQKLAKIHIDKIHKGLKKYACQYCDKSYTQSQSLNRHIDNIHKQVHIKGSKKYACQQCDKSYTQSHSLKSHVQIVHEGISPFTCALCGDSFKQRVSIKRHMERGHSGITINQEAAEEEMEVLQRLMEGENGTNNES